ncbi:peroxisomal membrane protein Pex17 [Histoplasma capsulatum H143]|uniref:Peroxisomal membrane protein Pex17 n=1 Tax=Ajellomyces capsulatus (strain H143) TaxID=544712 RepID=C6H4S2_AJECH|nr:peroxisomal membrane protein Pex17 [Histoplasma capsulatum H143]
MNLGKMFQDFTIPCSNNCRRTGESCSQSKMGTERSLATLLRSLQTVDGNRDAFGLLPSSTGLLSLLSNPLNVTLLSSHLLHSPALWNGEFDLETCRRILSVFNTAAISVVHNETPQQGPPSSNIQRRGLGREEWVKAVVQGADDKSPRWRHCILLGGILLGMEGQDRRNLPSHLRKKLESGLMTAFRLSLNELDSYPRVARYCIALVMNYTFELLADSEKSRLDYNIVLPLLVDTAFFSPAGFESGYFLGAIDRDIRETPSKKFEWQAQSPTFLHIRAITARPLISSLGPLSRLIAHGIESCQAQSRVVQAVESLLNFSRTLMVQWRQNKLSEVDISEEAEFLDEASLKTTIPILWRLLKTSLFSIIIVLRAVLGRVLNDRLLAADDCAPTLARKSLHILRNICFISARIGQNASSQYTFVNLTAIDILSQYPAASQEFLESIRPSAAGRIPDYPIDRCLDLFFLNTAEHFALILSPAVNEDLLISAALPYLAAGGNNNLLEIFEAAHSVALSVLAAPKSADMAAKHLPFYIDTLFTVFPQNLSARQFRLAFKTAIQITAAPSPLANTQPLLPSILLELLYDRALQAPTTPLPRLAASTSVSVDLNALSNSAPPLSEQAVLAMTMIDCLCFLRLDTLEEWLPLVAHLVNIIPDKGMRQQCQERFWDALSSGEMDVDRANFCVTWWSTKGGREMVLFSSEEDVKIPYMSGGLGVAEPRTSG